MEKYYAEKRSLRMRSLKNIKKLKKRFKRKGKLGNDSKVVTFKGEEKA